MLENLEAGMIGMNTGKHFQPDYSKKHSEKCPYLFSQGANLRPNLRLVASNSRAMARRRARMLLLKSISSRRLGR
jgi:hypothetical protein